jgi:hypothetical protein
MVENHIVGARFPKGDFTLLREVCDLRGEDLSSFVRRAVRTELARLSYYSPEVKKALGVKIDETEGGQK